MDDITLLKGAVLGFILVGKVFWENLKGHEREFSFKEKQMDGKKKISSGIFVSTLHGYFHFCTDIVWKIPFL